MEEDHPAVIHKPKEANFIECHNLFAFLAQPELGGNLDVMEIFGGESGVSKIGIRRKLKTGKVLDLVPGFDPTQVADQKILVEYIYQHQPMVIVAGPPRTVFANLSRINRWKNPDTYAKSRRTGLILARLMAIVAEIQMNGNRYFLIENPAGSELFDLPEFRKIWSTDKIGRIIFPQCSVGLETPEGEPIHKLTELWAIAKELLIPFEGIEGEFTTHGAMVGTYHGQRRSKLAQVWPPGMCERIVEGITLLLKKIGNSRQQYQFLQFPVEETLAPKPKGRPRKYPEAAVFDCTACRSSKPW